jgi:ubiquinone/menaquinone biosynthesis C-methylase UbiE
VNVHDLRNSVHRHGADEKSGRMVLTGRHAALYDRVAAGLVLGRLYRSMAAQLVRALPHDGSILDVGTGPGRLLVEIALRRPDLRVIAVDPSTDMVRHAQDRALAAGLADRIEVHVGTAEALPFPDDSFDTVSSTLSAHHWADIDTAITEQARVLRPGGRLVVYDLRRSSASVRLALTNQFPDAPVVRQRLGRLPAALGVAHCVATGVSPTAA